MMLTHSWVDHYAGDANGIGDVLRLAISDAVQFDCGSADDIPRGKNTEYNDARAPFPNTLLQFETPSSPKASHFVVLWRDQPDGAVTLFAAQRSRDKSWTTTGMFVERQPDGTFLFEQDGDNDEAAFDYAMMCHAWALNMFYILGCSNVTTADNPAPAALNKKRAKTGKFPVLEYKTLVLKLDSRTNGQPGGGTHASPRVHLRRGHVRKIDSDRRVWVQACVVGSTHGMVLKDYRVQCSGR